MPNRLKKKKLEQQSPATHSVLGLVAVRGLLLQEDAALRVVDVGKLVKQREPLDGVGVRDDLQVRVQGVGVAVVFSQSAAPPGAAAACTHQLM